MDGTPLILFQTGVGIYIGSYDKWFWGDGKTQGFDWCPRISGIRLAAEDECEGGFRFEPTHWMPLPKFPVELK